MKVTFPLNDIRAWLFDLDGTLMDTDDQAVAKLAQPLRFLGDERAARIARRAVMFGETPLNGVVTMLDLVGLDTFFFYLRSRLHRQQKPLFPLIAGVKQLLDYLHAEGTPLGVVTTRPRRDALAFLAQHELREHFSVVATQESTSRLKPHAEPVLYAAHELGLPPAQCVLVGDTPVDILSAKRAGAWRVGVLCGFGERPELERCGANLILPSTADLWGILRGSGSASKGK